MKWTFKEEGRRHFLQNENGERVPVARQYSWWVISGDHPSSENPRQDLVEELAVLNGYIKAA